MRGCKRKKTLRENLNIQLFNSNLIFSPSIPTVSRNLTRLKYKKKVGVTKYEKVEVSMRNPSHSISATAQLLPFILPNSGLLGGVNNGLLGGQLD